MITGWRNAVNYLLEEKGREKEKAAKLTRAIDAISRGILPESVQVAKLGRQ